MSALKRYLDKISEGKAIDYNKFLKALPLQYQHRKHELFSTELIASNSWLVTILDQQSRLELFSLAETPTSRIQAADQGNSHRISTTVSYVLAYHELSPDKRPDIVYLDEHQTIQGFKSKAQLLLIENEENFFQFERMCVAVSQTINEPVNLKNTDIALGSGMKVSTELNLAWYKNYDRVLCAFDYDLAGLQMFASLNARLQNKPVFVQPSNYSAWLPSFKKAPKSVQILQQARELAELLGFTELNRVFTDTRKFMEQELMLKMVMDE
tara:strand:+ start:10862 stop:11665 length:804 start_codon:yes stop_codon:yes gene_type:complete